MEISTLKAHVALVKGEDALRELVLKIISLPRQNVFGAVVIKSGALRRVITGEVLTEAQHTPMPSETRLFRVSYNLKDGTPMQEDIIAHDADDAIVRVKRRCKELAYNPDMTTMAATCLINEAGFAHLTPTKGK